MLLFPLSARMRHLGSYAAAIGMLVLLTWAGWTTLRTEAASRPIAVFAEEEVMQVLSTTWKSEGCIPHTVSTTKKAEETAAEFAARHSEAVRAAMVEWPPVTGC